MIIFYYGFNLEGYYEGYVVFFFFFCEGTLPSGWPTVIRLPTFGHWTSNALVICRAAGLSWDTEWWRSCVSWGFLLGLFPLIALFFSVNKLPRKDGKVKNAKHNILMDPDIQDICVSVCVCVSSSALWTEGPSLGLSDWASAPDQPSVRPLGHSGSAVDGETWIWKAQIFCSPWKRYGFPNSSCVSCVNHDEPGACLSNTVDKWSSLFTEGQQHCTVC